MTAPSPRQDGFNGRGVLPNVRLAAEAGLDGEGFVSARFC